MDAQMDKIGVGHAGSMGMRAESGQGFGGASGWQVLRRDRPTYM
jgi:hypothetical protein